MDGTSFQGCAHISLLYINFIKFFAFCHQFSEIFPYRQEFTSKGPFRRLQCHERLKSTRLNTFRATKGYKRPFPKKYLWHIWLFAWIHNYTSSWLNQTWHHFNFLWKVYFTHITIKIFKKLPVGVISIISCWCDTFWNDWKSN